nr:MAG TPA: hypothetical protein [Caudoviricetes sp.]
MTILKLAMMTTAKLIILLKIYTGQLDKKTSPITICI